MKLYFFLRKIYYICINKKNKMEAKKNNVMELLPVFYKRNKVMIDDYFLKVSNYKSMFNELKRLDEDVLDRVSINNIVILCYECYYDNIRVVRNINTRLNKMRHIMSDVHFHFMNGGYKEIVNITSNDPFITNNYLSTTYDTNKDVKLIITELYMLFGNVAEIHVAMDKKIKQINYLSHLFFFLHRHILNGDVNEVHSIMRDFVKMNKSVDLGLIAD